MPRITVTTTIQIEFEVPEGVSIEQVRHLGLSELSDSESATDEVIALQDRVMNQIYLGDALSTQLSVTHQIAEAE